MASSQEIERVRALLMELSLKLQWVLRRKGWRTQDPVLEKAAEYAGARTTLYIRHLRHTEPWLSWEVEEGTEDIVVCHALGIRCIPPPAVYTSFTAPAAPSGWCPTVPPPPAHAEPGRWEARGGRFFD